MRYLFSWILQVYSNSFEHSEALAFLAQVRRETMIEIAYYSVCKENSKKKKMASWGLLGKLSLQYPPIKDIVPENGKERRLGNFFNRWRLSETKEDSGKGFHLSVIINQCFISTTVEIKYESSNARSLPNNEKRKENVSGHCPGAKPHSVSWNSNVIKWVLIFSVYKC